LSYASGPFGPRTEQVYGFTGGVQGGGKQDNDWSRQPENDFSVLFDKDEIGFIRLFVTPTAKKTGKVPVYF